VLKSQKILLVGCGKMGLALLKSWVKTSVKTGLESAINGENIYVVEPDATLKSRERSTIAKVNYFTDYAALTKIYNYANFFDFIIFAVKPQNLDETIKNYKSFDNGKTVFVSIAAGKTIASLQKNISFKAPIIRTMPNLPATIGQAVTAVYANKNTSAKQLEILKEIFTLSGDVIELESEDQFDAVTAVSGSGPAYIFHLIECMIEAAKSQGLSAEIAEVIVKKTVFGSAKMAYKSTESATTLRQNVTSKGGTTEAALEVLMNENKMQKLFESAIDAATKRGKELNV
jgi:pyrroline-5-carboxylate reductase